MKDFQKQTPERCPEGNQLNQGGLSKGTPGEFPGVTPERFEVGTLGGIPENLEDSLKKTPVRFQ